MNNDTRQIRKAAANDAGEVPKARPRAPLEKVPGEAVLGLLEKGKMKEVAAMGRAAIPVLVEMVRRRPSYEKESPWSWMTKKRAGVALMMMGFGRECVELMHNRCGEDAEHYVRKVLDENEDIEQLKTYGSERRPLLRDRDVRLLKRLVEEAAYIVILNDRYVGGADIISVEPTDVEKLFSIMCVMDEALFDELIDMCQVVSERAMPMILNAGPQAIPVLMNGLSSEEEHIRTYAKDILEIMGEPAVLPLISVLMDKNSRGRSDAAVALSEIGDIRAVPALIEAAKGEDDGFDGLLHHHATHALVDIAEKHPEYDWREAAMVIADLGGRDAAWALKAIGSMTTDPELKRVLKEKGFLSQSC